MVTTYLCTYNNLQLLTNSTSGCELPTKCTTIISYNDFNHDGVVLEVLQHFRNLVQNLQHFF
jgi:hypothetical protein